MVPACPIRFVSGWFLTSSSSSSKMVSLVPPGKYFILTRLSFDRLFFFYTIDSHNDNTNTKSLLN